MAPPLEAAKNTFEMALRQAFITQIFQSSPAPTRIVGESGLRTCSQSMRCAFPPG
jgi:hypothetical protein